jgi:FO synthase
VNPEAPWPHIEALEAETATSNRVLGERLAIVPRFAIASERWLDPLLQTAVRRLIDASGHVREDRWFAGCGTAPPERHARLIRHDHRRWAATRAARPRSRFILDRVRRGSALGEEEIATLFCADGDEFAAIVRAADGLRAQVTGDTVTYVINRNINYTNICQYACGFCAFSKGRSSRSLRGPGYLLDLEEIGRRVREARGRGATEVCLQGGIHPHFTGQTYLDIVAAVKAAVPDMHVHAFSPLEIMHGAATLGLSIEEFLLDLKRLGLGTLPGTAAEILDDEIRAIICPDKLSTSQWLEVMRTAHRAGLKTTATVMFGHVETPRHWARHLLRVRELQAETGGFTEFVPLPFVHMEAPLWRRGRARSGPTFREAVLMHAVSRLALHPLVRNIQTSWVKMGLEGAGLCLAAGANDLGGTLMNESITRAAGGVNGQEQDEATLCGLVRSLNRMPRQRTTLYSAPVMIGGREMPAL